VFESALSQPSPNDDGETGIGGSQILGETGWMGLDQPTYISLGGPSCRYIWFIS